MMIFVFKRPDVFPVSDAGLRAAFCDAYEVPRERFLDETARMSEAWRPWRSVASCYLCAHRDKEPV